MHAMLSWLCVFASLSRTYALISSGSSRVVLNTHVLSSAQDGMRTSPDEDFMQLRNEIREHENSELYQRFGGFVFFSQVNVPWCVISLFSSSDTQMSSP
jgi:hypothetical protein